MRILDFSSATLGYDCGGMPKAVIELSAIPIERVNHYAVFSSHLTDEFEQRASFSGHMTVALRLTVPVGRIPALLEFLGIAKV